MKSTIWGVVVEEKKGGFFEGETMTIVRYNDI